MVSIVRASKDRSWSLRVEYFIITLFVSASSMPALSRKRQGQRAIRSARGFPRGRRLPGVTLNAYFFSASYIYATGEWLLGFCNIGNKSQPMLMGLTDTG